MTVDLAEVEAARALDKRALGRLVTRFEDLRGEAGAARAAVLAALDAHGPRASAHTASGLGRVVGVTGAPGAGKSTLLGELAVRLVRGAGRSVAVLAVDPSSPSSGGALLGDRTRVKFPPGEPRLFFRSQASGGEPGGVAPTTYQAARLLARLFDVVLVETVGVGQGELEIVGVADRVYLVVPPLAGDAVQFLKGGVMEIPDAFVVSKLDVGEAAAATLHQLRGALRLARPGVTPPVLAVSAATGTGVDALAADLLAAPGGGDIEARAPRYLERWVLAEFGRRGLARLAADGGAAAALARWGGFEAAQAALAAG